MEEWGWRKCFNVKEGMERETMIGGQITVMRKQQGRKVRRK
jgi:hypothetical protein